jgi:hypothetical protein
MSRCEVLPVGAHAASNKQHAASAERNFAMAFPLGPNRMFIRMVKAA